MYSFLMRRKMSLWIWGLMQSLVLTGCRLEVWISRANRRRCLSVSHSCPDVRFYLQTLHITAEKWARPAVIWSRVDISLLNYYRNNNKLEVVARLLLTEEGFRWMVYGWNEVCVCLEPLCVWQTKQTAASSILLQCWKGCKTEGFVCVCVYVCELPVSYSCVMVRCSTLSMAAPPPGESERRAGAQRNDDGCRLHSARRFLSSM